jgi:polysaccharide export outer membrane protein
VIHSTDELRPDADIHYVLVRRELPPDRRVAIESVDLAAALKAPGSAADLTLMPRDRIIVFDLSSGRDQIIRPIMEELRRQSSAAQPAEVVHVEGKVKVPGEYPLQPGMTVSDLVRAGGGLADAAAYGGIAELTRYKVENGDSRKIQLIKVDLAAALRGEGAGNLKLEPFDDLSVKQVSRWDVQESITLAGEVRFPGRYVIGNGETLRSVLSRAGGLTDQAFAEGSVFTREELKVKEQEQLEQLATRMQTDLTGLAIRAAGAGISGAAGALSVGQSLLTQLRTAKPVGRLVINLPKLARDEPGGSYDVAVRNGDRLLVPKFQQQVTIIGEVQSVTSHLYRPGLGRDDYIALSGGVTNSADRSKIYVVHADGSVVASGGNRWFGGSNVPIRPGDTIVVPLDTERMPALPFWQAVTGILYNVALGAAAIRVLN